jgi:hypothetical protein
MALLDLQARISDELKPEYLLIDARTGVTEFGGLATTVLADTVVCMLAANQESLEGTMAVVEALKSTPRLANQKPIRIFPVLSRTTTKPSQDERLSFYVRKLFPLVEGTDLCVLPHDDMGGTLEGVGDGRDSESPLYKAYVDLFQGLFPGTSPPPGN